MPKSRFEQIVAILREADRDWVAVGPFATSLFNQCAALGWDIPPNESRQILSLLGLDARA